MDVYDINTVLKSITEALWFKIERITGNAWYFERLGGADDAAVGREIMMLN